MRGIMDHRWGTCTVKEEHDRAHCNNETWSSTGIRIQLYIMNGSACACMIYMWVIQKFSIYNIASVCPVKNLLTQNCSIAMIWSALNLVDNSEESNLS